MNSYEHAQKIPLDASHLKEKLLVFASEIYAEVGSFFAAATGNRPVADLRKRINTLGVGLPLEQRASVLNKAAHIKTLLDRHPRIGAKNLHDLSDHQFRNLVFFALLDTDSPIEAGGGDKLRKQDLKHAFLYAAASDLLTGIPLHTTFGVEEEFYGLDNGKLHLVDRVTQAAAVKWIRDKDSSIEPDDYTDGVEMISPPMGRHNISSLSLVTSLLAALGAKAPLPCAFHVHAGMTNTFRGKTLTNLMKQIVINYMALEKDLSFLNSNLTYDYARKGDTIIMAGEICREENETAWQRLAAPYGRRCSKINLVSLKTYGTMEFRQHPGTVCPLEAQSWVKFVNNLIGFSLDMIRVNKNSRWPGNLEMAALKDLVETLKKERSVPLGFPAFRSQEHNKLHAA